MPQGSILGPILFLIYINDISNASNSHEFTIYADDTNMLLGDKDIHNLYSNLSTELNLLYNWIKVNRLKLNISKTNFILFQNRYINNYMPPRLLEGEAVKRVNSTKCNGVYVNESLNWNCQINEVCVKLSRICGVLYIIRNSLTTEALISAYYTLRYPHLIYSVCIRACTWPSFINKFTVTQKKILGCMFFKRKFDTSHIYGP